MNKKTIAIASSALLSFFNFAQAQDEGDFSASATYAFESEFIYRGYVVAEDTFTPSVEGRVLGETFDLYFGLHTALPVEKDDNRTKMHEYYVGTNFEVADDFKLDVGASFIDFQPFRDDSAVETFFGLTWEGPISPAVYLYYDVDQEEITIEASAGYSFVIDTKSAVMLTGFAGNSEFGPDEDLTGGVDTDSTYYGAMLDYSYSFTRYARMTVGVRFANVDNDFELNENLDESRLWWGASFTAGF